MQVIGDINIDFSIHSDSPRYLYVSDLSEWVYAENQPSYILITLPGSKRQKKFTFNKKKINIFNSHNLGLSCLAGDCKEETYIDLPDGIYTVCVKSNYEGIDKTKFYLKTDRFEVEYSKVMIKYELEEFTGKEFIEYMIEVKFLLGVAKSHAKLGDFVKASRFFEESKKMLRKYVECNNCL